MSTPTSPRFCPPTSSNWPQLQFTLLTAPIQGALLGAHIALLWIYLRMGGQRTVLHYLLLSLRSLVIAIVVIVTAFIYLQAVPVAMGVALIDATVVCLQSGTTNPFDAAALEMATIVLYAIIDCISQSVLIYRCWVIWDRRYWLVALPALMSLTTLAFTTLFVGTQISGVPTSPPPPESQLWGWWNGNSVGIAGLCLSIATNAYTSGFLLSRLAMYSREQKERLAISPITQSTNLRQIMVVLIESGIAIFVGQVAYLLVFTLAVNYTVPITPLVSLLYGIATTAVLIRVRKGASQKDQTTHMSKSIHFNRETIRPTSTILTSTIRHEQGGAIHEGGDP